MAESVRRLRVSLQAERICHFGSRARDKAHEDSDYDFLVVVPRVLMDERSGCRVAREVHRLDVMGVRLRQNAQPCSSATT